MSRFYHDRATVNLPSLARRAAGEPATLAEQRRLGRLRDEIENRVEVR
jgi:hypothetical protein